MKDWSLGFLFSWSVPERVSCPFPQAGIDCKDEDVERGVEEARLEGNRATRFALPILPDAFHSGGFGSFLDLLCHTEEFARSQRFLFLNLWVEINSKQRPRQLKLLIKFASVCICKISGWPADVAEFMSCRMSLLQLLLRFTRYDQELHDLRTERRDKEAKATTLRQDFAGFRRFELQFLRDMDMAHGSHLLCIWKGHHSTLGKLLGRDLSHIQNILGAWVWDTTCGFYWKLLEPPLGPHFSWFWRFRRQVKGQHPRLRGQKETGWKVRIAGKSFFCDWRNAGLGDSEIPTRLYTCCFKGFMFS